MKLKSLSLLGCLPLVIIGCGGGGGGGAGSCGANPTCGGDVVGTWKFSSTCVEGDVTAFVVSSAEKSGMKLPAACRDLFQDYTIDMQGTVVFSTKTETDSMTIYIKGKGVYTPACVSAKAGTSVAPTAAGCATVESELKASGEFSKASCGMNGSNCECQLEQKFDVPTTPQPYTASAGRISYSAPSSSSMTYCISGTTMTTRSTDSSTGLTTVNTLEKQ